MKKTIRLTSLVLAIVMMALAALPLTAFASSGGGQSTIGIDNYTVHNVGDNTGYYPSSSNKTDRLSSGHLRLGWLNVTGNIAKKNYNGTEAIAVYGGNVTFTYKQTWSDNTWEGNAWRLSSDSATSIAGYNVGTIGSGGIIVLKSLDEGRTWTSTGAYSTQINGSSISYQPSGADIAQGVMLKFISVAEGKYTYVSGRYKNWHGPFRYTWENTYADAYDNFVQETVVYVASDTAQVGFYSTAIDNYDISKDIQDVDAEAMEILKLGTTLTGGSVSFDKIRVDKLGNKSFDVRCSYNDSSYFTVSDGASFDQPGRYHFIVTTKFQRQSEMTLYIFKPGDDLGYSQYFGNSYVSQSKRVFDKTSKVPVYMVGTTLNLSPKKNLPGVYGNIIRYADVEAVKANNYEIVKSYNAQTSQSTVTLNKTGIYCADLYVGNPSASGQVIHYEFYLQVVDRPEYRPTVNYELLTSATRPINLTTKHYAVNYVTAGGGSYVFVFPATEEGYEQALEFSENIEKRFVEEYEGADGKYYYYKAHGSSGLKERYDSKVELYENLYQYAKENVNLTHTVSTEKYATMTLDEAVKKIETTSISKDIKVTVDLATRDKLLVDDKLINGYKYYKAADYEVNRVTATDEEGNVFEIPFDTEVDSILPKSGRYTITEFNWNGKNTYTVNFISKNEVTGSINYTASKSLESFSGTIDKNTAGVIEANSITLVSGKDQLDSQTIVTVSKTGSRKNMLLSELDGSYTITEPGTYTVTITNRCGYTTKATVKLTPAPRISVKFDGYSKYDTTVDYGAKLGELPTLNKYGYEFQGWQIDGSFVTSSTVCNWKNDITLTPVFKAKKVQVLLNYFGGYTTFTADFDSTVTLEDADNIEDVFTFGYWDYNGQQLDGSLKITSLDTVILVAKYFKTDDKASKTAYTAYEVAPMLANRKDNTPSLNDNKTSDPVAEQPEKSDLLLKNPVFKLMREKLLAAFKQYMAKFRLQNILKGFNV